MMANQASCLAWSQEEAKWAQVVAYILKLSSYDDKSQVANYKPTKRSTV